MKKRILLFFLICLNLFSYKLEVGSLERIQSGIVSLRDAGGNRAIVIQLETNLDNLRFESGMGIVRVDKVNRGYDLFLSSNERFIDIFSDYDRYRLVIRDHISQGRILEGEAWKAPINIVPEEVEVRIVSTPQGNIFLNGKNYGSNPNIKILEGEYSLRIVRDDYRPIVRDIVIDKNRNNHFDFVLEREFSLTKIPTTIMTIPQDARKIIDGVDMGTGIGFQLDRKKQQLEVKKDGYVSLKKEIDVNENNFSFANIKLTKDEANLSFDLNPINAKVKLESIELPYTSGKIERTVKHNQRTTLASGRYKASVSSDGYIDKEVTLDLKVDEDRRERIELVKDVGFLTIKTNFKDAIIKIDDKIIENPKNLELRPKEYKLQIEKQFYKKIDEIIKLESREELIKTYELERLDQKVEVESTFDINLKIYENNKLVKEIKDLFNTSFEIPAGKYTFEYWQDEYVSQTRKIVLEGLDEIKESISLIKDTIYLENSKKLYRAEKYRDKIYLILVSISFILLGIIYLYFKKLHLIYGYNEEGYDKQGYDREGYNKEGYDKKGYDREGYDSLNWHKSKIINRKTNSAYDIRGYDIDGYNIIDWNALKIHKKTATKYNPLGYDINGYNKDGYNREGYDRRGYDKDGYLKEHSKTYVYMIPKRKSAYHSNPNCSGSGNKDMITLKEALMREGYPCSRCGSHINH